MNSELNMWLAQARTEEFHRAAQARRPPDERQGEVEQVSDGRAVTLRFAFPDDIEALARLAVIDSAEPPTMPVLVAEVDGLMWAALSLADGSVVADPFRPTAAVVELLRARARQLAHVPPRRRTPRSLSLNWLGFRLGA